jgi:pimeloyl-ACP methyl ester carboxylesterase
MATPTKDYRSVWTYLMRTPFRQDYIDVRGLKTRYVEAGRPDSPAVILLHGTGGHWEAFCANIGAYAEHFHVFAFDMKGAGFADKPDVDYEIADLATFAKDFMAAVGVKKASLVGVSLGAWTAALVATTYPEIVERIVLVSPVGVARLSPNAPGHDAEKETAKRVAIVKDTSWENTRNIFKGLIYDDEDVIPDLVAIRQAIHRLPNAERDMAHVLTIGKTATYERAALTDEALAGLQIPALVFVSEHDNPFFRKAAQIIAELAPNAKLIELKNVAHWAQFEAADYFNELTIQFLGGK